MKQASLKTKKKPLASLLAHTGWPLFAGAVLAACKDVSSHLGEPFTHRADSAVWWTHSVFRAELFGVVRTHWCRLAEKSFTDFPYSEDFVVSWYRQFILESPEDRDKRAAEVTNAADES